MALRRRTPAHQRRDMVEELERLIRRLAVFPLVIPVLLLGGWGLGKVTARGIALPPGAPVRIAAAATTPAAHLESLATFMAGVRDEGEDTEAWVLLYNNHVRPVERSLARWGINRALARRVAWPLVENAYARGIDPATVAAIMLVESSGRPDATSVVGARGLMQVMPLHLGHWECGPDLYDIDSNLCYGTAILEWNLDRFDGNERRALLAYNGCVHGRNTPGCHTYPDRVFRLRDRFHREWRVAPAQLGARSRPGSVGAP